MKRRSRTFAAEHANVRSARAFVREVLADLDRDVTEAVLFTSELVSNAIEYASSEIEVVVCVDDRVVRVEVHDGFSMTEAFKVIAESEHETVDSCAPRGRGLVMVRRAAARFGVLDKGEGGKAVWFELVVA
jgi:anti-sigma regulatory factor (Ser/Thr protein kinase)